MPKTNWTDPTITSNKSVVKKKHIEELRTAVNAAEEDIDNLTSNKLNKSGGTMTGILTAQNNTSYTTKQVRNITLSTSNPSGGQNGDIWIKYR